MAVTSDRQSPVALYSTVHCRIAVKQAILSVMAPLQIGMSSRKHLEHSQDVTALEYSNPCRVPLLTSLSHHKTRRVGLSKINFNEFLWNGHEGGFN